MISPKQMDKYTELTIKQFVDSSADIRWCPYPDCGYAICMKREARKEEGKGVPVKKTGAPKTELGVEVGKEEMENSVELLTESEDEGGAVGGATVVGVAMEKALTCGENVECGQGHGFCWYVRNACCV